MKITTLSAFLIVLLILPTPILAQKNYLIIDGKKYELAPGPSYYDAHPEERNATTQPNKPIDGTGTREQGNEGGSHIDYPSAPPPPPPSSAPPPPSMRIGVRGGVIDGQTGDFYPQVKGGVVNPRTGEFLPDVEKGYIDLGTGEFIPKR
jgi:hypothetical protein